jgi:hypothetical protein
VELVDLVLHNMLYDFVTRSSATPNCCVSVDASHFPFF